MYVALGATVIAVAALHPFAGTQLGATTSFVPAMLALVTCFDLVCATLLTGRFRDTGSPRLLALAVAYLFSLILLLGWGAAFPGVFGTHAPLGGDPSNAPWLWVGWHTAFPVLLGVASAPWRRRWETPVPMARREGLIWRAMLGSVAAGVAVVAAVVVAGDAGLLPVVIHGLDTSRMTAVAGPVMIPLIAIAVIGAIAGARRRGGPERWVAVAATTALADVVLTLFSTNRFSLGWYAGRTMSIISSGVVLVALVAELGVLRRHLMRLQTLQRTLIEHMAGGVVMEDETGTIVAHNPVAAKVLRLAPDALDGRMRAQGLERILRPDGNVWPDEDLPNNVARRTGRAQPARVVGLHLDGGVRWLQVESTPALGDDGEVEFVVSTLNDVTDAQVAEAALRQERQGRIEAIESVIARGGIRTLFQPIVDLETLEPMGLEALSRFPGTPPRGPEMWFDEAASLGMGARLELAAMTTCLAHLPAIDPERHLSVNVSPESLLDEELQQLLYRHADRRLIVELTEHMRIPDYGAVTDAITGLRSHGIQIAVDDAGAGFASLKHILDLGPDVIKLDLGLTRGIDADPARRSMAASLVRFGEEVGATIIAEGVETQAELTTLRLLGLRFGQGYLLGRPQEIRPPAQTQHRQRLTGTGPQMRTGPRDCGAPSTVRGCPP